ncbi:MAG: FUSC family protein [Rhodococcus sp.]|uniref:FUSC family protein n=1 Tax=Rhodococcus sp. TaxID=1831 RepID=UPI0016B01E1F|nr:FUSC family protein [Rhodococcus sp. (in: high G+C Gram-positive bacteria)]NLV81251.1 FUSC family protein [Rhodococcus sp. (in: high G+C Gram-positive bacteria)]
MLRTRPDTSGRLRHSTGALAHSLSSAAWRDAVEVRRADPTIAVALRVGTAVLVVLVAGGLLGYTQVAGFAALGALCAAFVRYEPYPRLVAKLVPLGIGMVGYTAFGAALGVLGLSVWIQIFVLALAAGVAYWLLTAFRVTGPGPVVLIFAAAGAAGFADTAADIRLAAGAAAIGSVVGVLVALVPALHHPHGPARVATARALASVAALETDGATGVPAARTEIARARDVIALGPRRLMDRHTRELLALLAAAEEVVDSGDHDTIVARRDDFVRFETELRRVRRDIEIPSVDGSGAPVVERPDGFVRQGVRALRDRAILVGVGRVALASLLSGWFAAAAGLQHPLWATMGAMAALQGANYRHTVARAIQRLVGNAVGALLAAGLLVLDLDYWPMVVAIVLCQTITEMYVTRNYAIATVFVTSMALLLTAIAEPLGPGIGVSRVGDTLVGVVIGVIVAALTIDRHDRHHLEV